MDGIVTPEEVNPHIFLLPTRTHIPQPNPPQFDYFHELVITQEFTRVGARGYGDGLLAGMVIGLPPLLNFAKGNKYQEGVIRDVLDGKKKICLAVSEAWAGSDVGGLKTEARKSEDGKEWIVNGTKKWVSSFFFCLGCVFWVGC